MTPRKIRTEIPQAVAAEVQFEADRMCCVCRTKGRPIQLHHIDEDPCNNAKENLVVLCFECHRETQLRGGFDRKLDAAQIVIYRADWVSRVAARRDAEHGPKAPTASLQVGEPRLRYLQFAETSDEHFYSLKADYPQLELHGDGAKQINLAVERFITRTCDEFRTNAIATAASKRRTKETIEAAPAWDDLSISHSVSLISPYLFSVKFSFQTYFAMAPHPNSYTRTLNFRVSPQMQLDLTDLFKPSSTYLELLSKICVADLHKQQIARWWDPAGRAKELEATQDEWILQGAGPSHSNLECFAIEPDGIRIFFDPYRVGSYAEGPYDVFIHANQLAPKLKEWVAALLTG